MLPPLQCPLTPGSPGRDAQRARLLVVDDNPAIRSLVRRLAAAWGYRCGEAPDGEAASRCVQCQPVSLVITDHDMPRLDGIALLRRLAARAAEAGEPMLPAILMSGDLTADVAANARQAGAQAVLWKPLDTELLRTTVADLLAQAALARSGPAD